MNLQDLKDQIGKRIKTLREAKGWTQKYLGDLSDSTESYICEVEAGKRSLPLRKLWRIADALGAEVTVLIELK